MSKRKTFPTKDLVNTARTSYKHVLTLLRKHDIEPLDSIKIGKRRYMVWGQEAVDCVEQWRYDRDIERLGEEITKAEQQASKPEVPQAAPKYETDFILRRMDELNERINQMQSALYDLPSRVSLVELRPYKSLTPQSPTSPPWRAPWDQMKYTTSDRTSGT